MREGRIKIDPSDGAACYHCICRTIDGEFLFDDSLLEFLRIQIWKVAEYCGVEVFTYALLSNHFHLLVRIPKKTELSDEEVVRRYRVLYPVPKPPAVSEHLEEGFEFAEKRTYSEEWKAKQVSRMGDLSCFMKILKLRFSAGYKARRERRGTLWSDRFKSVLVEDGRALEAIAAYIDLNPVRAGIVEDPKEYRFCGYAEAVAGNRAARRGIASIFGSAWKEASEQYRCLLFGVGAAPSIKGASISDRSFKHVLHAEGRISTAEALRCCLRYMTYGAVLGSRSFVETEIAKLRRRYNRVRDLLPNPIILGDDFCGLTVLRGGVVAAPAVAHADA